MPVVLTALICLLAMPGAAHADAPAAGMPPPVQRVLEGHGLSPDGLSLFVQAVNENEPLLTLNGDAARNPASIVKLVTTFAALDLLGPAHSWRTEAWLAGTLAGERLEGDLVLKGGGDPYLTTERFWSFLRELRSRGLRHVQGDLVIDNSYFDTGPEDTGAFDGQPFRTYNVPPDALLVNLKAVRFRVWRPAAGAAPRVTTDPDLADFVVDNRLRNDKGPCRGFQRGVAFDLPSGLAGNKAILSGRFPTGCADYSLYRTVLEPAEFTYGVFKPIWNDLGGSLAGQVRYGQAPQGDNPFAVHASVPLAEVVRNINKFSNNAMTRQVFLTIGAELRGAPGTPEKARASIGDWLTDRGLEATDFRLQNGSGLSRETRVTADGLGELLLQAWRHPLMPEFVSSLALSGTDGTLRNRFRGTAMAGRMHIKTGRLDHVYGLAGYVHARSGTRYVVVAIHNDEDVHRGPGREAQDALLRWVYAR